MEESAQVRGKLPGRLLKRAFFEASPELVAPLLLGKVLAHITARGILADGLWRPRLTLARIASRPTRQHIPIADPLRGTPFFLVAPVMRMCIAFMAGISA